MAMKPQYDQEQYNRIRQLADSYNLQNFQQLQERAIAGEEQNIGKWELDVEPYLDRIYNELLGNSQDEKGVWKRDFSKQRVMNELGASDFISEITIRISIHMQFSDLSDEDILEIASETAENYGDKIEDNWKIWEIKPTFSNYEALGMKMYHSLFILLRIAKNGGMKKHREKSKNPYLSIDTHTQPGGVI